MDDLYENRLNVGHVNVLLSQFTIFCTVRNEERDRNGIFHIVARIQPELPVKGPSEGIHIGKARVQCRVDDPGLPAPELPGRLGEAVLADVLRGRQPQTVPEQPVGIPRGKEGYPRQIREADLPRPVPLDVVLHPLDRQDLFFHMPQLLTGSILPQRAGGLSTFFAVLTALRGPPGKNRPAGRKLSETGAIRRKNRVSQRWDTRFFVFPWLRGEAGFTCSERDRGR